MINQRWHDLQTAGSRILLKGLKRVILGRSRRPLHQRRSRKARAFRRLSPHWRYLPGQTRISWFKKLALALLYQLVTSKGPGYCVDPTSEAESKGPMAGLWLSKTYRSKGIDMKLKVMSCSCTAGVIDCFALGCRRRSRSQLCGEGQRRWEILCSNRGDRLFWHPFESEMPNPCAMGSPRLYDSGARASA